MEKDCTMIVSACTLKNILQIVYIGKEEVHISILCLYN